MSKQMRRSTMRKQTPVTNEYIRIRRRQKDFRIPHLIRSKMVHSFLRLGLPLLRYRRF